MESPATASAGLTVIGRSVGACPARAPLRIAPPRLHRPLRILREDPPLPHRDARLGHLHLDQELGPLDGAIDEGRRDSETSRRASEEVCTAGEDVEPGAGALQAAA